MTLAATITVICSHFLIFSAARELDGVIRYRTSPHRVGHYIPTYGRVCNDTKCGYDKRHPMEHPPVLSLDEMERRQRVAALHRLYITSQQYRPHSSHLQHHLNETVRIVHNDTCIRCPKRQLARIPRNHQLAKVPKPKLKFCSRPEDALTDFPLMVLRGPRMGSHVEEGDYIIIFKTLVPLPAKTCKYTLKVYALRCPPVAQVEHGRYICTNRNLWGSRCQLECAPGFEVGGGGPRVSIKCVKRRRQALWKMPPVKQFCRDTRYENGIEHRSSEEVKSSGVSSTPSPKRRRLACRWPKEPHNGWSSCGQRGRWRKRLFVREHVPCARGCNTGFEPSHLLPDGRNSISCIGGAWDGHREFMCSPRIRDSKENSGESKEGDSWSECESVSKENKNVVCAKVDDELRCEVQCGKGFAVDVNEKEREAFVCGSGDVREHEFPECRALPGPKLVKGCQDLVVKNASFPIAVEVPSFEDLDGLGRPLRVHCNQTVISSYGEFNIFCQAEDAEVHTSSNCSYKIFTAASYCRTFQTGPHVLANCNPTMHSRVRSTPGLVGKVNAFDSLPVDAECEFICEKGYTIPTSRLDHTFTHCQKDGTWTIDDFNLCRKIEPPRMVHECRNQTLVVDSLPEDGLPFDLPEYVDSEGDPIEAECTPARISKFGDALIRCDIDDIELRLSANCEFSVSILKKVE